MRFTSILIFVLVAMLTRSAAGRPNVVFILADDMGIGDLGCYGGQRCKIHTANLDHMAAGGMKFTNAYANASVCIPTRVAIMTGRYPWRFGRPEPGGAWGYLGLRFNPDTYTLGNLFRDAGYRTGYVGKWHLGTQMTTTDGKVQNETNVDFRKPIRIGPPQFGFDDSFVLPGSLDMYPYVFAKNNRWQGNVESQKGWSAFNRVGPAADDFEDHRVLETFYQQSETFLRSQSDKQPFFLFLALTAPHTPISPGEQWRGQSELGPYGDFVMEADHGVGRIIQCLKANQMLDDTLVIFSSDHGPASYAGNIAKATPGQVHRMEAAGHFPSGPHRGYKFSAYEGGLHVPLIAHWPAKIPSGASCDALIGLCDLMATFADVIGQPITDQHIPDSISFASQLLQADATHTRSTLILQSAMQYFVVRQGKWKLCLCPGSGARGVYGNQPASDEAWEAALKSINRALGERDLLRAPFVQLFDLSNDPHEDHNLAADQPELVAELVNELRSQIDAGRSTSGEPLKNDRPIQIHQRLPVNVKKALEN